MKSGEDLAGGRPAGSRPVPPCQNGQASREPPALKSIEPDFKIVFSVFFFIQHPGNDSNCERDLILD